MGGGQALCGLPEISARSRFGVKPQQQNYYHL
jgi:hypothetical protein